MEDTTPGTLGFWASLGFSGFKTGLLHKQVSQGSAAVLELAAFTVAWQRHSTPLPVNHGQKSKRHSTGTASTLFSVD